MKVWLTGAAGRLGSVLRERLEHLGVPWVATGRELDIGERAHVFGFAERERPTLIVNAAAYTRVDAAETHEAEAFRANALGPEHLGAAAARLGSSVVHFSSDMVFDGRANEPYREDAPLGPVGAYARSKAEGEARLLAATGGHATWIVRTSWLFFDRGPSFVARIRELLAEQAELRVVVDQRGRLTYAPDLADATLWLSGLAPPERHPASPRPPGTYHFANRGEATRHAVAVGIRERSLRRRLPVRASRITAVASADYPLPAPRPAYSVLDTRKVERVLGIEPRHWDAALDDYFSKSA
jgi:dTDP-4-dehydrorhamnose reductase